MPFSIRLWTASARGGKSCWRSRRRSDWRSGRNTRLPLWRCRSWRSPPPRGCGAVRSICAARRWRSRCCSRRAASGTSGTPSSPGIRSIRSPSPGPSLPALYGRAEMRAWDYHVPVGDLRALGSMLIGAGIGFAFAFAVVRGSARARARRRPTARAGASAAAWRIFWFASPIRRAASCSSCSASRPSLFGQVAPGLSPRRCALGVALVCALIEWPTIDRLLLIPVPATAALFRRTGAARAPLERALAERRRRRGAARRRRARRGAAAYAHRDPGYSVGDETARTGPGSAPTSATRASPTRARTSRSRSQASGCRTTFAT